MTEVIQPIPARLKNVAVNGHVAGADDIIDDTLGKDQATINSEVTTALGTGGTVDQKIAAALEDVAYIDDTESSSAVVPSFDPESQTVHVTAQTLSEQQKTQVRENIGLGDVDAKINEAVASEASQRAAAVSGVQASVNAEATARANAVSAESSRAQAAEADRYTKSETYTKEEVHNLITTPSQEYVSVTATSQTTAVTDVLPATGAADTTYRVGNWDGTQYNDSVFSEYAWNGSAYIKLSTKSQVGEVYDISANHADTKYADLAAALGTDGANIPQNLRKGGMSVKFVLSSDNKYVQFRYILPYENTTAGNNAFVNTSNWVSENVDIAPIKNSHNLVESGGVNNVIEIEKNTLYVAFEGLSWNQGYYNYNTGVFQSNNAFRCTPILSKNIEEYITNIENVGTQTTGVTRDSHKSLFLNGVYNGYLFNGVYKTPSGVTVESIEYDAFAINEYRTTNPNYSTYYKIINIQENADLIDESVSDLTEIININKSEDDYNFNKVYFGTLLWRDGYYTYNTGQYNSTGSFKCTYLIDKKYERLISNINKVGTQTSGATRSSHKSLFLDGSYVGYLFEGVYKTPSGSIVDSIEYDTFAINEYIANTYNPNYLTYYVLYSISEIYDNIGKFKFNRAFYALGDSTTAGAGSTGGSTSWANILDSIAEFTSFTKLASNGSFCVYHEGYGRLSTQIGSVPQNISGIVTIMIGTNDFFYDSPLGDSTTTLAKSYSNLTDTDNFADAFRYNLETLKRKCPDAIIICMTPLPSNDVGNANGHFDETNLFAIRDIERTICNAMGIPIIESQYEFGLSRYVEDWNHFFSDFCHPNDVGYDRIAHCMLGKFIEFAQ